MYSVFSIRLSVFIYCTKRPIWYFFLEALGDLKDKMSRIKLKCCLQQCFPLVFGIIIHWVPWTGNMTIQSDTSPHSPFHHWYYLSWLLLHNKVWQAGWLHRKSFSHSSGSWNFKIEVPLGLICRENSLPGL